MNNVPSISPETINNFNPIEYYEYVTNKTINNKIFFPNKPMSNIHNFDDEQIKLLNEGKQMVKDYKNLFNSNYNQARQKYYKLVDNAEQETKPIKQLFEVTPKETDGWQIKLKNTLNSNSEQIVKAIKAIGEMNIYREESYICVPTIMHIVRVLQENKNKNISTVKYPVTYPVCINSNKQLEGPICELGNYGYLLGMLEQIGFILRFKTHYCEQTTTDYDENKCSSKMLKYMERYNDAITKIDIKILTDETSQLPSSQLPSSQLPSLQLPSSQLPLSQSNDGGRRKRTQKKQKAKTVRKGQRINKRKTKFVKYSKNTYKK
jgi:hypothetical protein